MSYFVRYGLRSLPIFALLLGVLCVAPVQGQEKEPDKKLKELKWSHAFDLACRKFKEADITEKTKRWGVEAFRDDNTVLGVYISETGSIAVGPHFQNLTVPVTPSKGPVWLTGLDLPTRKAGESEFKKDTKVHAMEVFRDPNADNWLYITEQGNIAATSGSFFPGVADKTPKWVHSVDLNVRKGGVKEWKDASKVGVEVYKDGNTKNLIFITEQGQLAVIPEFKDVPAPKEKQAGKAPEWLHGLDLSCRKHNEKSFTKDTRKYGVEVYHDATTHTLIFISEAGSIAVTAAPDNVKAPTPAKVKEPQWTHGLNIKCRQFGEKEFSDTTRAFGAEVFVDPNLNVTIYINEDGKISVLSAK
jgi:hypothetical protein